MATLRITPVVDGARAFVEWSARFDCAMEDRDHWTMHIEDGFSRWLGSLRTH